MLVKAILTEASELTGLSATGDKGPLLFKKISRSIQCLANQGLWDAQQLHLDINVQPGGIVILPREVLSPIKITINKQPAFSRNRLYEFSLNGPGVQDGGLTGWQWMDQNSVPLLADLPSVGSQLQVQGSPADAGKKISFFGLDNAGNEIKETVTIDGTLQTTLNSYVVMRRVTKDITQNRLPVTLASDGTMVANYYGDEIEPRYRKIKLSKKAVSIHMLFRRVTVEVTTADDYIALDSELAVLYMLRANEIANNNQAGPSEEVANYQKLALQYLQDEQKARNSFAELAAADELQPGFNLNINNRDSLIAADVIDEVFDIFGPIGLPKAFDRLTDCVIILDNKSQWEGSEGYVDLNVGCGGIVTLPRYIHRPVKINIVGRPARMRNRWFEFHLDGPGSTCRGSCEAWDDLGESVTVFDPVAPFRLVAINDIDADDGATLRVYGYDTDGKWIRTPNPDLDSPNKYIDGVILTANYGNALPDQLTPVFSRIERITRDATSGYQQLLAFDETATVQTLIGYYAPDETEPRYSRIRLPYIDPNCPWIRMRYRKRGLKISSLCDQLNLKSRLAVVNGLRAIKAQKDNPDMATKYENIALNYLQEELAANNPSQQFQVEVDPDEFQDQQTAGLTF